jgi:hypothetical protein
MRLKRNDAIKITKKTINNIFAMPALSAAIPPKPKTPAIIASTKKTRAQFNNISSPIS